MGGGQSKSDVLNKVINEVSTKVLLQNSTSITNVSE